MIVGSIASCATTSEPTPEMAPRVDPHVDQPTTRETCRGPSERVEVRIAGWFRAASGLGIRYEGVQRGDALDGYRVSLTLLNDARGTAGWIVDPAAPPGPVEALGHCIEWVSGDAERVSLDVSLAEAPRGRTLPACAGAATAEPLIDYETVEVGHRYHFEARRHPEAGEWVPAEAGVTSTGMAFTNLSAFPALVAAQGPVHFEIEVEGRHQPADERLGFYMPYRARVLAICR